MTLVSGKLFSFIYISPLKLKVVETRANTLIRPRYYRADVWSVPDCGEHQLMECPSLWSVLAHGVPRVITRSWSILRVTTWVGDVWSATAGLCSRLPRVTQRSGTEKGGTVHWRKQEEGLVELAQPPLTRSTTKEDRKV